MFFGKLGLPELGIILGIAVLIFGPRRLPQMGKAIGETIRSFREAGKELHGEAAAVCPTCQVEVDGKFCPECGTRVQTSR